MDSLRPAAWNTPPERELLWLVRRLALAFSMTVTVALPVGYFYLNYTNLTERVETMAQVKAVTLAALASGDPEMWKYNYVRVDEMLRRAPIDLANERITVRDLAGDSFLTVGESPDAPTLTLSSPVYDFGREVGHVEISHSYRSIVFGTLAAALLGLLLGVVVYAASTLPLRALRRVSAALAAKQAEEQRRAQELIEELPNPIFFKDRNGHYLGVNKAWERYFGTPRETFIGKTVQELYPNNRDVAERLRAQDQVLWEHPGTQVYETSITTPDGQRHDAVYYKATLTHADGSIAGLVGTIVDITERKKIEEQVRQLGLHDTLTNLPNRRLLNDRLGQTLAASKRSGRYGMMMFLDLDNFKHLNDTYGHGVGDMLLIEAAERLESCVRETDTVARFGGDEFVVMISELSTDKSDAATQAGAMAEKIRAALAKPYVLQVRRDGEAETTVAYQCTASIGAVLFGKHDTGEEDVLKQADTAMYQAKEAGRNLIRFYGSSV